MWPPERRISSRRDAHTQRENRHRRKGVGNARKDRDKNIYEHPRKNKNQTKWENELKTETGNPQSKQYI